MRINVLLLVMAVCLILSVHGTKMIENKSNQEKGKTGSSKASGSGSGSADHSDPMENNGNGQGQREREKVRQKCGLDPQPPHPT